MAFSSDTEIERTTRGMIDRTLPKEGWTHEAHFAAPFGWLPQTLRLRNATCPT